jgi:transcriptional regulator with XRE-family HTH domain
MKLKRATLQEMLEIEGRGSQRDMSVALGVPKSTISNLAKGYRKDGSAVRAVRASYALAKRICAYAEGRGYQIDLESLVRTEDAA